MSLGMSRNMQQECFANAFLQAVAATAGCALSSPVPDDDSVDWTLSCKLSPRRPKLDVQMKSTILDDGEGTEIQYALKRKNYDDLVLTDVVAPRLLVLVIVPNQLAEWLTLSSSELVLRRCAYWVSLAGRAGSVNETSVTISVPRTNLFTVDALCEMMRRINEGGVP